MSEWNQDEWNDFERRLRGLKIEQLKILHKRYGIQFSGGDPNETEDYTAVLSHDAPKKDLIKMVEAFERSNSEEYADSAVQILREFIVTEDQLVQANHNLEGKIWMGDHILGFLTQYGLPDDAKELYAITEEIIDKVVEIRYFIEEEIQANLHIIEEEKAFLNKLNADVGHREWRMVVKKEKTAVRLAKQELRTLHKLFIDLMKIIKRSKHVKLPENLEITKAKEEFFKKEDYFLTEIYKYARAYERIIRQLWEKERILLGEIKKRI